MRKTTILTATIGMMVAATIALYVAKVLNVAPVAGWSWWAVYSPLWAPWALVASGAVLLLASVGMDRLLRKLDGSL